MEYKLSTIIAKLFSRIFTCIIKVFNVFYTSAKIMFVRYETDVNRAFEKLTLLSIIFYPISFRQLKVQKNLERNLMNMMQDRGKMTRKELNMYVTKDLNIFFLEIKNIFS